MTLKKKISAFVIYVCVFLLCAWSLAPFFWTMLTSFQSYSNITAVPPRISFKDINAYYYQWLFKDITFRKALLNSVKVVTCATLVGLIVAALGAYSLGVFNIKGKGTIMFCLLSIQLAPAILLLIPLFVLMRKVGLLDTFVGLVSTYLLFQVPVGIWMLRGFFEAIPRDIFDSARIDGCSSFAMFWQVALPLVKPGLLAVGVYTFITGWGELLIPMTIGLYRYQLLTVYASAFGGLYQIDYGGATAVATISGIPSVILALVFRRYLVSGLTAGAVKG